MNPIGAPSFPTQRPVPLPLPPNATGAAGAAAPAGASAYLTGPHDPDEARAAAERGLADMEHAHDLAPCERQALVELLAWHELARELYPCAEAPDALLRPPTGPEAEAHLARSIQLALERARRAAADAEATEAVALPSAPTPREVAIANDCAKLLSERWGPDAYCEGMACDWAEAPRDESFPTVPARLLAMALCSADLRQADLHGKDLSGLDLSSLCLAGADLSGCDVGGASFKNADLSRTNLRGMRTLDGRVGFTGANLQGANLSGSHCQADYVNANLRHTNLRGARGFVRLDGADLSDIDLSTCGWQSVSAKGAMLRGAMLPSSPFNLREWAWRDMDLTGARAPARLAATELEDEGYRDSCLNHVENQYASCLSNLASIPEEGLRVQMMRVLVEGLAEVATRGVSLSSNRVSLCDVLLRDAAFLAEPRIRDFVDTHLGPVLLDQAAGGQLLWAAGADAQRTLDHPVAIAYGLQLVYEALPADDEAPAEACAALARLSAPLNQLLAAAGRHPACAEVAQALRQAWVEQLEGRLPGLRAAMETESLEPREAGTYVEVSRDGRQALAYEQSYMDRLEGREGPELVSWGRAYRFEARPDAGWEFAGGPGEQGRALTADLAPFPWIQRRHLALTSDQARGAWLQATLGAGETPNEDQQALLDFLARAAQSSSLPGPRPWLSADGQARLERIFAPLLEPADPAEAGLSGLSAHTRFTPAHERTVLDHLQQGFDVADPRAQARYLLAAAQRFTYASSSAIMGTHDDSPGPVRAAAVACLNLADKLDPTLLAERAPEGQVSVHQDWVARLTGELFSCTAILASAMSVFVHAHPIDTLLAEAHARVLPQLWR